MRGVALVVLLSVSVVTVAGTGTGALIPGVVADTTDAGDSRGDARSMTANSTVSGSIVTNDTDWYAISLDDGTGIFGNLTITTENEEDLRFDLFTPNGDRIGEAPNDGMGATYATNRLISGDTALGGDVTEQSGTYYVRVNGTDNSTNKTNYELTLETNSIDKRGSNERPATATPIEAGATVSGVVTGYDRDVYAVDLQKGETVTAVFDRGGQSSAALYVLYPNASSSASDYSYRDKYLVADSLLDKDPTFTANETGTYYVQIVQFYEDSTLSNFNAKDNYEFTISVGERGTNKTTEGDSTTETLTAAPVTPTTTETPQTVHPPKTPTATPTTATTTKTKTTVTGATTTTTAATTSTTATTPTASDSGTTTTGPGFGVFAGLIGLAAGGLLRLRR